MKNKIIVSVVGVPGSGKTTFSQMLSCRLGAVPVLCTDTIKAIFEEEGSPLMKKVSHNAWELFGECTEENIIKGYRAFSEELFSYTFKVAKKIFKTYDVVILEGLGVNTDILAHIDCKKLCVYMKNNNIKQAYKDKLQYRANKVNNWEKNKYPLEVINKFIYENVKGKLDTVVVELDDKYRMLEQVVNRISEIYV